MQVISYIRRTVAAPFGQASRDAGGMFDSLLREANQSGAQDPDHGDSEGTGSIGSSASEAVPSYVAADIMRAVNFVHKRAPSMAWPAPGEPGALCNAA